MADSDERRPPEPPAPIARRDAAPGEVAGLVPDEPRHIDLRGLLLTGRCDIWAGPDPARGFVAVSWDYPFAGLHGRPAAELVVAATRAGRAACTGLCPAGDWQLLALPEDRPFVEEVLPGWHGQGIALHRPPHRLEDPPATPAAEIRLLPDGHRGTGLAFDHVPGPSRHEYTLDWVSRRPMAVAVVNGLPVSFCYAAFTTERWWDVSVETLEPFRRRGLAAACFLSVAAHMEQNGLEPVWGAMLDNPASLGLAARLGFVRNGTLEGWSRPD